jgi:signal transduction histidine kinase
MTDRVRDMEPVLARGSAAAVAAARPERRRRGASQRMNVASRIRWMACALVVATAVAVAVVESWGYTRLIEARQREGLGRQLEAEGRLLESALKAVATDVAVLAELPAIDAAIAARRAHDPDAAAWLGQAAMVISGVLRAHPAYARARVVDRGDGGPEILRLERPDAGSAPAQPARPAGAGAAGPLDAVLAGLAPGEAWMSDVTLRREGGSVAVPHVPVLEVALPVHDAAGAFTAIVAVEVDFARFVDGLFPTRGGRYAYYVADGDGDYLIHPERERAFGFELGRRYRVQDEFPRLASLFETGATAVTVNEGAAASDAARLVSFRKVFPHPERPLALGISASYDDIAARTPGIGWLALGIVCVLLVAAVVAAWLAASVLTAPLARITDAVRGFARGDNAVPLPVERADEIGILARTIDESMKAVKDREAQILATTLRLQEANADLEHFAHIASHDLREPARRVAGLADFVLLTDAHAVSPQGREMLELMRASAVKMLDQITDFRALTKIGHGVLARTDTDLKSVAAAVLAERAPEVAARRAVVRVDALPTLPVHANLVRILYDNLVRNALQHASQDGFELELTAEEAGGGWILGVRNTHAEIRPEDLTRIFRPFTRLRSGAESSGLGLAICKRIAGRHGGAIWAESGPGYVHVKFSLGGDRDGDANDRSV